MTRIKIETPHGKTNSKYQLKINKKDTKIQQLIKSNKNKDNLISKYESMTKDLLENNILSKHYVSYYITKKEDSI